jgi:hypothetical protein
MPRFRVLSLVFAVAVLATFLFCTSLLGQQPASEPLGKNPDVAANPGVDNMYVPPITGQPFTGKSVVSRSGLDGSNAHIVFINMLARDSKGRIYFENRRLIDANGEALNNLRIRNNGKAAAIRQFSRSRII